MSVMTILPDLTGQTITSIKITDFGRNIIDIHLGNGKTLSIWGGTLAVDTRLIELDKIELNGTPSISELKQYMQSNLQEQPTSTTITAEIKQRRQSCGKWNI